jgi:positive regulator of sigma E activity
LNWAGAGIGDRVEVVVEGNALLRWSMAVYLLPLGCMITAAIAAQSLYGASEALTAVVGFLGLGCGFSLVRLIGAAARASAAPQVVVQRRLIGDSLENPENTV